MKKNINLSSSPNDRSDRPSGRQAPLQPEHNGEQDAASLHQGQGPDFQTQDETLQEQNEGVEDFKEGFQIGSKKTPKARMQEGNLTTDMDNAEEADKTGEELPSRERGNPYVGGNPDETKRESPQMQ